MSLAYHVPRVSAVSPVLLSSMQPGTYGSLPISARIYVPLDVRRSLYAPYRALATCPPAWLATALAQVTPFTHRTFIAAVPFADMDRLAPVFTSVCVRAWRVCVAREEFCLLLACTDLPMEIR